MGDFAELGAGLHLKLGYIEKWRKVRRHLRSGAVNSGQQRVGSGQSEACVQIRGSGN